MAMNNMYYSRNCGNKRKEVKNEKKNEYFKWLVKKLSERWSEMIVDDILDLCELDKCRVKVKTIIEII